MDFIIGPQIFLQAHVLRQLVIHAKGFHPQKKLAIISLAASFLSLVYNCSQAIVLVMGKANYVGPASIAVASALYSSSALVVRYIGFETLTDLFVIPRDLYVLPGHFVISSAYVIGYSLATIGIPSLNFWRELNDEERALSPTKRFLLSLAFAYISFFIGPLYPLLKLHKDRKRFAGSYRENLLEMSVAHILPDVVLYVWFNRPFLKYDRYYGHYGIKFKPLAVKIGLICGVVLHIVSAFSVFLLDKYIKNEEKEIEIISEKEERQEENDLPGDSEEQCKTQEEHDCEH